MVIASLKEKKKKTDVKGGYLRGNKVQTGCTCITRPVCCTTLIEHRGMGIICPSETSHHTAVWKEVFPICHTVTLGGSAMLFPTAK